MGVEIPIFLLAAHFVGDFLLQSDWMALNKSKSNLALSAHCWTYSFCLMVAGTVLGMGSGGKVLAFFAMIFATHWWTDYFSSRATSKLWFVVPAGGEGSGWFTYRGGSYRHWFFVVIGLDQLVHYLTLALIWRFLN